ncbi:hypothetical protein DUT91_08260 [Phyllobacterium salinisoli]|uniref:Tat pathway signal sequence domain protein n=1 Tax=Phyllobacterium salinisoli TaxID=1899321 RepID=A0A368K4H6_9HYPH|nr:hypothetical protein [Phyllobacterium salinisoli]RCS24279.1 hypothetical protein DUT91_08260 [Phyllobacterium salinisoli]
MLHPMKTCRVLTAALAFSLGAAGRAPGQESPQGTSQAPALSLELNALDTSEKGCRLTFVAANEMNVQLDKVTFEMVLFNAEQRVERLALLDFKTLPAGKTKVRRFDLANIACDSISRILINDATECSGEGLAEGACIRQLKTSSKSSVRFGI